MTRSRLCLSIDWLGWIPQRTAALSVALRFKAALSVGNDETTRGHCIKRSPSGRQRVFAMIESLQSLSDESRIEPETAAAAHT